jgi:hypothetical protein
MLVNGLKEPIYHKVTTMASIGGLLSIESDGAASRGYTIYGKSRERFHQMAASGNKGLGCDMGFSRHRASSL